MVGGGGMGVSLKLMDSPIHTCSLLSTRTHHAAIAPPVRHVAALPSAMDQPAELDEGLIKLASGQFDVASVQNLSLPGLGFQKVQNLEGCLSLTSVDFSGNNLVACAGFEPIANQLRILNLSKNRIDNLAGLREMVALEVLMLATVCCTHVSVCAATGCRGHSPVGMPRAKSVLLGLWRPVIRSFEGFWHNVPCCWGLLLAVVSRSHYRWYFIPEGHVHSTGH